MPDFLADTAERFRNFAYSYQDRSPLYYHLISEIVDDPEILALAVSARNQPPHILFGAVHYLLLSGIADPLAEYYASIVEHPAPPDKAWPAFRRFCLEHQDEIRTLLSFRIVQTNEVTRCSGLYLAFGQIPPVPENRPISLVEIGASAGLNLLLDRYGYDYNGSLFGDLSSPVRVVSTLRGERMPAIPQAAPNILYRCGIDLNPIDLDNPDEMLWLRSLVWPEQRGRVELLKRAIELARQERPRIVRGNALDHLQEVVGSAPEDSVLCVVHSYMIHTWSEADREKLNSLLSDISKERDLYEIAMEWVSGPTPKLELISRKAGMSETRLLALCDDHGRWIEWIEGKRE